MKLLLPLGFLAGAIACALLLRLAPQGVAVDLAQPLIVVTYWQQFGAVMFAALAAAAAISSIGYIFTLRKPVLRATAALCAVACACALAFPVIFSSDVYAYAAYGDMALHGIDPYAHAPVTVHDALLDAALWQWGNPPPMCVYGPLFLIVPRIAALLLPLGPAAPLWILRVLACLALVACVPLANAALWRMPRERRVRAATLLTLNPAAIWACAEGHNDIFALALVLGGVALARHRAFAGAALAALAAAVKAPALAAAVIFAASTWPRARIRARAVWGTVTGALVATAISLPLIEGIVRNLAPAGKYFPQYSPQFAFSLVLPQAAAVAATILCACALAIFGRLRAPYVIFALWLCIPNPYPWYGIWLLAAAALCRRRSEQTALAAAATLVMLRYYGEATGLVSPAGTLAIVALAYGVPAALLVIAGSGRSRFGRQEIRTAHPAPVPARPR